MYIAASAGPERLAPPPGCSSEIVKRFPCASHLFGTRDCIHRGDRHDATVPHSFPPDKAQPIQFFHESERAPSADGLRRKHACLNHGRLSRQINRRHLEIVAEIQWKGERARDEML